MNYKTRHLDKAIEIMGGKARTEKAPWRSTGISMRAEYELALLKQGWACIDRTSYATEFKKVGAEKRMMVFNGNRVAICLDGVTWKTLGLRARRNLLLGGQT